MSAIQSKRSTTTNACLNRLRSVRVEVRLGNGTAECFEAEAVRGTRYLPWTYQEVRDKARSLMQPVIGHDRAAEVCDLVSRIEEAGDTLGLMNLLSVQTRTRPP